AADSAYGRDGKFRAFLQAHRMPYVVEVPVKQTVADTNGRCRVDTLIGRAPVDAWHRAWAGEGCAVSASTTGPGPLCPPWRRFRPGSCAPWWPGARSTIPPISPTTCVFT